MEVGTRSKTSGETLANSTGSTSRSFPIIAVICRVGLDGGLSCGTATSDRGERVGAGGGRDAEFRFNGSRGRGEPRQRFCHHLSHASEQSDGRSSDSQRRKCRSRGLSGGRCERIVVVVVDFWRGRFGRCWRVGSIRV